MKPLEQFCLSSSFADSSLLRMAAVLIASNGLLCCAAQQPNARSSFSGNELSTTDVVLLAGPKDDIDCSKATFDALTWERSTAGTLIPTALKSRPPSWHKPTESYVELAGGALVAVDRGEFADSGLFWRAKGTTTLQPVEVPLNEPIRAVFQTSQGTVGVAGLCHGGGPFVTTLVSLLPTSADTKWEVQTIAHVRGCPAALQFNPSDDSVVVATADGEGLVSASSSKVNVVATWPANYHPKELHVSPPDDSGVVAFYLGFGQVLAVFRQANSTWYTIRGCSVAH